jgi:hypothetical protein
LAHIDGFKPAMARDHAGLCGYPFYSSLQAADIPA